MRGLAAILIALALTGPAHAVTITNDNGGTLEEYWQRWLAYAKSGEWVELRGVCASACTIYLALPNACVGKRSKFLFHAPSNAEPSLLVLPSAEEQGLKEQQMPDPSVEPQEWHKVRKKQNFNQLMIWTIRAIVL